jgi:hypothetical protein
MHYTEFLLHLAHASILAFPVCYMNDTSLGVSHADGKRKEYHEDFPSNVYAVLFELTLRLRYLDFGWPGPPFWPAVVARFVRISAISASAVACAYPPEIGDDQVSAQAPRSPTGTKSLHTSASVPAAPSADMSSQGRLGGRCSSGGGTAGAGPLASSPSDSDRRLSSSQRRMTMLARWPISAISA